MRLLTLALLLASAPAFATAADRATADAAKLEKALAGRVAGAPVSCVSQHELRGSRIIGQTIFYDSTSRRLYRNDPPGGCPGLSPDRAIVSRTSGDRICQGDIIRSVDMLTHTEMGACGLGQFVPYVK